MPNEPKTPKRQIRISDETWFLFMEKAAREGTDASKKIRAFIDEDLATDPVSAPVAQARAKVERINAALDGMIEALEEYESGE